MIGVVLDRAQDLEGSDDRVGGLGSREAEVALGTLVLPSALLDLAGAEKLTLPSGLGAPLPASLPFSEPFL